MDLAGAEAFVDYYLENGPSIAWKNTLISGRDAFGFEGWLAMMVGQKVPYRRDFRPDEHERQVWHQVQEQNRSAAAAGFTVGQTLEWSLAAVAHPPRLLPLSLLVCRRSAAPTGAYSASLDTPDCAADGV